MRLENCPFCDEGTVFDEDDHPFVEDTYKCGCQTEGCRGNIKHSPWYQGFEYMKNTWNNRGGKKNVTITNDEYMELSKDSQMLCALQSAGVDNWNGYEHAQDIVEEWDNE